MTKKLLLTSSGLTTPALGEAFRKLLPKPVSAVTIAVIPTAGYPEPKPERVATRLAELRSVGIRHIRVLDIKTEDEASLRAKLQDCDALCVNGGNTFWLLDWVRRSAFDRVAAELLARGVLYVGVSAGAYIACPTIEAAGWERQDDNVAGINDLTALNLVPFLISAHYDDSLKAAIREGAARTSLPVVALRDGGAIMVNDAMFTFIGEGEPVAFNGFAEQYLPHHE
jgi:dipeptidase E